MADLKLDWPVFATELGAFSRNAYVTKIANAESDGASWVTLDGFDVDGTTPTGLDPSLVIWPADPAAR